MIKAAAIRATAPLSWWAAVGFYRWAEREISPTHPDVLRVQLRKKHYEELLADRDQRHQREARHARRV